MRKIFTFVTALVVSMTAMAADFSAVVASGQTLFFNIVDAGNHTCRIVAGDTKPTGELVIPATVVNPDDSETYTIEGIGNSAFRTTSDLTSVTFPTANTFTYIGQTGNAFTFMESGITSLVIPDNVTFVGQQAFRDCGITSVSIGAGLTTIPNSMFYDCRYLKRVVLPNTVTAIEEMAFSGPSAVKYVELGNAIADGFNANAFGYGSSWSRSNIDTIVINTVTPPTVSGTFDATLANRALLYVPVGSKAAYKAATGWKDFRYILEIGEELTIYDIQISGGYSSIEGVRFAVDGTDYAQQNFTIKRAENSEFTIQANFSNKYYGIKQALYDGVDVTAQFDAENKATFTVTKNATLSFTYEQKTHPYDFTEEVASGQTLYFKIIDDVNHKVAICNQTGGRSLWGNVSDPYDGNVTEPSGALVIPASITHEAVEYTIEEIDTLAFHECSGLTSVSIPDGIKAIRAGAFHFQYGTSLGAGTELVIPQSCTRLELRAFQGCQYTSVNPGGAEVIEQYAFLYNPLTEIKLSSALRELHQDICQSDALTEVGLGENVEFVSSSAFYGCSNLATVTCLATTPPAVKNSTSATYPETSWSGFNPASATLYVPASEGHTVLDAYKAANCWKLFGTIAEISEPTAIDNANAEVKAQKRIVNGQLLIERDGRTYNALGVEMK